MAYQFFPTQPFVAIAMTCRPRMEWAAARRPAWRRSTASASQCPQERSTVRTGRGTRPFCSGCPGLIRSMPMPCDERAICLSHADFSAARLVSAADRNWLPPELPSCCSAVDGPVNLARAPRGGGRSRPPRARGRRPTRHRESAAESETPSRHTHGSAASHQP